MFFSSGFFALNFPMIDPVFLHLGPLEIRWYGIGYAVGIFFAFFYSSFLLKKKYLWHNQTPPLTKECLSDFIFWSFLGIIIGGRLGHVLLWEPGFYLSHPLEIFKIWNGGMAFHGGLIGLTIATIIFTRKYKIHLLSMFDILAVSSPFGIGIVRLCNFINGELWGRVSDVPWAVYFPNAGPLARHPSQIYEAFLEGFIPFIILAFLIFFFRFLKQTGLLTGCFLIFYGFARIIGETFREPDPAPLWFSKYAHEYFTYGMLLCLPMIFLGIIFIVISCLKKPQS